MATIMSTRTIIEAKFKRKKKQGNLQNVNTQYGFLKKVQSDKLKETPLSRLKI